MAELAPNSRTLQKLGDYAIVRVVGEGGMGIVYEAIERLSGRRVALKVLHSSLTSSPDARGRFFNEMRIMAGLAHPNVVRSLSCAEIEGRLVMVLEYLQDRTLRDELHRRGALGEERALEIGIAVASALHAAHEMNPPVVHRDLKPENLMLLDNGEIKVMDFGVAKVLSDEAGKTRMTEVIGTVQYMSPEQAEQRRITPKTDLYALGLVLYEVITGRLRSSSQLAGSFDDRAS